ncbi:MAG TPA: glycosyltransferase family 2 protein, partial [Nitrospirales bacterium]|nr:glycosyltransferase family 2 protein [Nitrospirales bacterium]
MPLITVYIASRNYGHFLGDAIESVLQQTIDNWELLLIDDGSIDDTSRVIDLYREHPKVRVHRTEGIGLPAVNNLALREAKGEYIIRLDGDDMFDLHILQILASHLDRDSELALVFPDYYLVDESGEIFAHERRQKLYSNDHLMDV